LNILESRVGSKIDLIPLIIEIGVLRNEREFIHRKPFWPEVTKAIVGLDLLDKANSAVIGLARLTISWQC